MTIGALTGSAGRSKGKTPKRRDDLGHRTPVQHHKTDNHARQTPDQQGSGLNECRLTYLCWDKPTTYLCWDKPTIASRPQDGCTGPRRAVAPTARARGFTADSDPLKGSGNNAVSMRLSGHSRPGSAAIGQIAVARPFQSRVTTARTGPAQSPVPQGFDAPHSP